MIQVAVTLLGVLAPVAPSLPSSRNLNIQKQLFSLWQFAPRQHPLQVLVTIVKALKGAVETDDNKLTLYRVYHNANPKL